MKITRFAQSCLLVEINGKKILVDPGDIQYQELYLQKEWSDIDILLVTHKHGDHCYIDAIKKITTNSKTEFYTSQEVANTYPEISPKIVKEGDVLNLDKIKIEIVKAVHGWTPLLRGEKEVNENIAFIIDDGVNRIYQTSDTICFDNNYKCDVVFLPVVNHGIVMGPFEAALFAKATEAKLVIPIHYDNPKFPADFELIKKEFEAQDLNYKFLEIGKSIEL